MVHLIVQIPCYNEEEQLAETLAAIPKEIPGVDLIETLIIDDGSTDETTTVARRCGATYLLALPVHLGLAQTFFAGIDAALKLGADVIVNTDADHQYPGSEIPRLLEPILAGEAEMVIGDRAPHLSRDSSFTKRKLQRLGSWVVRRLSGTDVPDAASGFRAMSRHAALSLNGFSKFTYTLETIVQAGKKQVPIAHVSIRTNPERRKSRLFNSVGTYVRQSAATLIRIYAQYEPLRIFWTVGTVLLLAGTGIGLRFLFYYLADGGAGHIQSLILAGVLLVIGFQTMLIGLVSDLIAGNRSLLEDVLFRLREFELREPDSQRVIRLDSTEADPATESKAARASL